MEKPTIRMGSMVGGFSMVPFSTHVEGTNHTSPTTALGTQKHGYNQ